MLLLVTLYQFAAPPVNLFWIKSLWSWQSCIQARWAARRCLWRHPSRELKSGLKQCWYKKWQQYVVHLEVCLCVVCGQTISLLNELEVYLRSSLEGIGQKRPGLPISEAAGVSLCTCRCFLCVSMCAEYTDVWVFVCSQLFVCRKAVTWDTFQHLWKHLCLQGLAGCSSSRTFSMMSKRR